MRVFAVSSFYINSDNKSISYDEAEKFLGDLEVLLRWGKKFLITIAKEAADVCVKINEIFKRHGIEVAINVDSDPTAMDYVTNALIGGVAVGAVGTVVGGAAWWIAKRAATVAIPAVGPFLLVGSIIGGVIGVIGGLVVTRWGLTIRFSPINPNNIDIELLPAA